MKKPQKIWMWKKSKLKNIKIKTEQIDPKITFSTKERFHEAILLPEIQVFHEADLELPSKLLYPHSKEYF